MLFGKNKDLDREARKYEALIADEKKRRNNIHRKLRDNERAKNQDPGAYRFLKRRYKEDLWVADQNVRDLSNIHRQVQLERKRWF